MRPNSALDRLRSLRVMDVMNKEVVTVGVSQTMAEVGKKFVKHGISAAPVVDEMCHCVGVISATDFLRWNSHSRQVKVPSRPGVTHHCQEDPPHSEVGVDEDLVNMFMTPTVKSVPVHASILKAAMLMSEVHIHRLPVLDEQGRAVGMVSTMDVVAALLNALAEVNLLPA